MRPTTTGPISGRWLSPEARSGSRAVARDTVHRAPALNCAPDDSAGHKLCFRRQLRCQTVHLTTTRPLFRPLAVAKGTVWPRGCRRRRSLTMGLSSDTQSARVPICSLLSARVPIRPLKVPKSGYSGRIRTLGKNSARIRTLDAATRLDPHSRLNHVDVSALLARQYGYISTLSDRAAVAGATVYLRARPARMGWRPTDPARPHGMVPHRPPRPHGTAPHRTTHPYVRRQQRALPVSDRPIGSGMTTHLRDGPTPQATVHGNPFTKHT